MRYDKGAKALLANGQCLVRSSWTDGSYLMMNSDNLVYMITCNKKGKMVKSLFDPSTQYYAADDYEIKRTYDDYCSGL